MTPDEIEAVKTIAKSLSGTSIALVHLIVDLSPIIGNDERDRLLKIIDNACTVDNNEQEQGHEEG